MNGTEFRDHEDNRTNLWEENGRERISGIMIRMELISGIVIRMERISGAMNGMERISSILNGMNRFQGAQME
jgi:hypothetical protein